MTVLEVKRTFLHSSSTPTEHINAADQQNHRDDEALRFRPGPGPAPAPAAHLDCQRVHSGGNDRFVVVDRGGSGCGSFRARQTSPPVQHHTSSADGAERGREEDRGAHRSAGGGTRERRGVRVLWWVWVDKKRNPYKIVGTSWPFTRGVLMFCKPLRKNLISLT